MHIYMVHVGIVRFHARYMVSYIWYLMHVLCKPSDSYDTVSCGIVSRGTPLSLVDAKGEETVCCRCSTHLCYFLFSLLFWLLLSLFSSLYCRCCFRCGRCCGRVVVVVLFGRCC